MCNGTRYPEICECEEPIIGRMYYGCGNGNCGGYKCEVCDGFMIAPEIVECNGA